MKALLAALILALVTGFAHAEPKTGVTHRVVDDPTAAVRDAGHDPHLRVTIWYPAGETAVETQVVEGPPGGAVFDGGRAAPDATWRDPNGRYPVILLSHGFGGAAIQTAWLGTVLARHGYVVISVDHPGNNGVDKMTLAGATLWWLRAQDLRVALAAMTADPAIGPHLDASRIGAAGFSIGGYTVLNLAGARPVPTGYLRHCHRRPEDGICKRQKELPELDPRNPPPEVAALQRDNPPPTAPPARLKALFLMAPAVIPGFDPASLRRIDTPTAIVLGAADDVATPKYNGEALAKLLPHTTLTVIPGVNHYDFLDQCTPQGQAVVKTYCRRPGDDLQATAHSIAIRRALQLFDERLAR